MVVVPKSPHLTGILYDACVGGILPHRPPLVSDTSRPATAVPPLQLSIFLSVLLVILSGLFAGLTLGLMSLDKVRIRFTRGGRVRGGVFFSFCAHLAS